MIASLAELRPWMPWATMAYDLPVAESWCRAKAGQFILREQLQFLILLALDGSHAGNLGLFGFDWRARKCEIGYWLSTRHVGHGYMSEAVQALTRLAFDVLGMTRVEIGVDARNLRSRRVAERCGYQIEGVLRKIRLDTSGKPYDSCVYSRLCDGK